MAWLIIILGSFAAGMIQISVGFGAAVLLMSIFPYCFDMITAAAISGVICLYISGRMVWQYRKSIDWHVILTPTVCYAATNIIMIRLLGALDLRLLTIAFGGFLIILSLYYLFFSKKATIQGTRLTTIGCSLISGACAGLFGVGGPMMALYFLAVLDTWDRYMGCLQMLFVVANVVSLITRISSGIYTVGLIPATVVGILFVSIGAWVGNSITQKLNADTLRKIVYLFVGISGIVTIVQHLF